MVVTDEEKMMFKKFKKLCLDEILFKKFYLLYCIYFEFPNVMILKSVSTWKMTLANHWLGNFSQKGFFESPKKSN